jgi:hypothetical protein
MTKSLTVDQSTIAKLGNLGESLELRDEAGRTLGYFTPAQERSSYAGVEPPANEVELQRREQEEVGRPLQEILADLGKRA